MRVLCVNDKKLPEGAEVVSGKDYVVEEAFTNNFGQRTFILEGILNRHRTSAGMLWYGYDATRFAVLDKDPVSEEECEVEEDLSILN